MIPPVWFDLGFAVVALAMSVLYAANAFDIFGVETDKQAPAWKSHQYWFNFAGSIFGWAALWVLVPNGWIAVSTEHSWSVTGWDLVLVGIAFVGITGHLPFAVMGVLNRLQELAIRALGGGI